MFNVRLAGGHLYGKQLFTWLSLVVSLMASFMLSFFPVDVLDEIWDLSQFLRDFLPTLPVPGRPTYLDSSRARANCACSRCGCVFFWTFLSHLSFLFTVSLSLGDDPI